MPFVQGESLNDLLAREKQLSIKDAVQIVREVAEALGHAHTFGLVHRDIKPHNVMMSGGHAIVADFGIAQAVSDASGDKLTQTGMAVGTPAYMSPEQIGGAEVDARADIYSLGCVLYELLVGQVPFTGPTPMAVMARHSMDTIPPPNIMRPGIPEALEDVIFRAMAKVPADRFRTMYEMAEALGAVDTSTAVYRRPSTATVRQLPRAGGRRRWVLAAVGLAVALGVGLGAWKFFQPRRTLATGESGLDPRGIAVLYFEDLSRDKSLGHVADGLTEGLIDQLSHVSGLNVVSRNGVAAYRDPSVRPDSVATALGVGSLLTGSIDQVGDRVDVTVRLKDGASGAEMGRKGFELPAGKLLAVRDSVIREVAALLRSRLGDEVRMREERAETSSEEAWSLVQRAERTRKDAASAGDAGAMAATYGRADSLARLAAAADPQWADPWSLRAQVSMQRASMERGDPRRQAQWLDSAIAFARHALDVKRDDPQALSLLGRSRLALYNLDVIVDPLARARLLDSAEADLKAATDADGTQAVAFYALSQLYYARKDNQLALINARRAYETDAFLRNADANLRQMFWTNYDLEQFPDAEKWCGEGARRFPKNFNFAECRLWLMITPDAQPDIPRAWALADSAAALAPADDRFFETHLARLIVGGALARAGRADSAKHVLVANRVPRGQDQKLELSGYEAIMWIILGDRREAVSLLKAYVAVNPGHEFVTGRDLHWWWRPLRDDPDFQAVTARKR
jgi:serine/threonine-protein kinase